MRAPKIESYLESPGPDERVEDTLRVAGWVFSRASAIVGVVVRLPGVPDRPARFGLARPDVGGLYSGDRHAGRSGFEIYLDMSALPRGAARLEVLACLDNGQRLVFASRRIFLAPLDEASPLPARKSHGLVGTAASLALAALWEGRLPLSPARWMRDLAHLRRSLARPLASGERQPVRGSDPTLDATLLRHFLASGARLQLGSASDARVSVVMVLLNRAELTLRSLRSLAAIRAIPLEVIIVDNGSSDDTALLLSRLDGPILIRNQANLGFVEANNQGAAEAHAPHLLLLNNDAEILPGSLEAALAALETSSDIGAVGGKLLGVNGRLQEAGSIIFRDGSSAGYGRDDDPWAPAYMFRRDVDYCSAAFLLTRRELFAALGGLDTRFSPIYYEDADYCARLWQSGRRVVYEPRAVVVHAEYGSAGSRAAAIEKQAARRDIFRDKHAPWLERRPEPQPSAHLAARDHREEGARILFFDDRIPHQRLGSGFGRANEILRSLVDLGHFVTVYPLIVHDEEWSHAYDDIPASVELMLGSGPARLSRFMQDRAGYYHCVIVSRPPNMQLLREVLGSGREWLAGASLVYDAEAIWSLREVGRRRLAGEVLDESEVSRLVDEEVRLARDADVVFCASPGEQHWFATSGHRRALVLGHSQEATPTTNSFESREGVLLVGSFSSISPNGDAALWFVRNVLPDLRRGIGETITLTIAGWGSDSLAQFEDPGIRVLGPVEDLSPLYERARLFVAPARFAAGLPLKICEAASRGVPVVCTPLLAGQLGWTDGSELLVGQDAQGFSAACQRLYKDPSLWRRVRERALERVRADCSPAKFRDVLREGLATAVHAGSL